jgi:hypothetical protein
MVLMIGERERERGERERERGQVFEIDMAVGCIVTPWTPT